MPTVDRIPPAPCDRPSVRAATAADLPALLALEQAAFPGDRLSRRQYRHHLASPGAAVLVATGDDGGLLGCAVLFFRRGGRVARLYSLATAAEARGRGVASALLEAADRETRARGCEGLRLEVRLDNGPAIALYERRGFLPIGRIHGYYEDGTDALRLEKPL